MKVTIKTVSRRVVNALSKKEAARLADMEKRISLLERECGVTPDMVWSRLDTLQQEILNLRQEIYRARSQG